jgi:hypothetical protein
MSGRDEEIGKVVAELEALMKDLRSTVEALSGALPDQDKPTEAPATSACQGTSPAPSRSACGITS